MDSDNRCEVCENKDNIILQLQNIKKIIKIKNKFSNRFGRIVFEETIDYYWNQDNMPNILHINENIYNEKINKLLIILNYLKFTNFCKIKRTNELFGHIVKSMMRVTETMKSKNFNKKNMVQLLTYIFDYKNLSSDINFICWVLSNNKYCEFVFKQHLD